MFNVTVINIKKSLIKIALLICIIFIGFTITQIVSKFRTNEILQINISEQLIKCLSIEIPAMENTYYQANNIIKEDKEEDNEYEYIEKLLKIELAQLYEKKQENSFFEEKNEIIEDTEEIILNNNLENVQTEIVTQNLISESYNTEINGVKIKNETNFEIDETVLDNLQQIHKENILIFHTHTCESYTPSEQYQYEQTGNFRTTDLNFSVARVGDELTNCLKKYGINVFHDTTYHDYPAYTGSYTRSKNTVENILKNYNSDIIIDLHRDAIGSKSNYDPSVKIGEEIGAQLMFVIGTNGGGLYHPNWKSNLSFAIQLQEKANEIYPELFKPIIVRNSRYNQHLGNAACIIEVGATGNTLEQCLTSMKFLAKVLSEL